MSTWLSDLVAKLPLTMALLKGPLHTPGKSGRTTGTPVSKIIPVLHTDILKKLIVSK